MINEGCLDTVDEVYGFHNIPSFDEGDIRVCSGPIMASATNVKIKVLGKGGHGSLPHKVKDPITAGAYILNNFHAIKSRLINNQAPFVFTITQFTSGFTYNVFPDEAFMQGSIRAYSEDILSEVIEKVKLIATSTAEAFGCKAEVEIIRLYPATVNHEAEAGHVERLARAWFGDEHFSTENLPITASEDFSYYL